METMPRSHQSEPCNLQHLHPWCIQQAFYNHATLLLTRSADILPPCSHLHDGCYNFSPSFLCNKLDSKLTFRKPCSSTNETLSACIRESVPVFGTQYEQTLLEECLDWIQMIDSAFHSWKPLSCTSHGEQQLQWKWNGREGSERCL